MDHLASASRSDDDTSEIGINNVLNRNNHG
jgi:hypothetical protein